MPSETCNRCDIGELEWEGSRTLQTRICNALRRHNVHTVGQLCELSAADLLDWPHIGHDMVALISNTLNKAGLGLRGEHDENVEAEVQHGRT